MKSIVVLSDTHGNKKGLEKLLPIICENDYVIHLGDGLSEVGAILENKEKNVYFCAGNCDFFSNVEKEGVLEVEDVRIFYCHGHRYGVKSGLTRLVERAKELHCQVAFYGHTHVANIQEIGGVTLVCPGTLRAPMDRGGSYAYVVVAGKKVTAVVVGENPR